MTRKEINRRLTELDLEYLRVNRNGLLSKEEKDSRLQEIESERTRLTEVKKTLPYTEGMFSEVVKTLQNNGLLSRG